MKILVTGAAGFIGHHLVEHLQATTDHQIVGMVSYRHKGDSLRTVNFDPARMRLVYHDLRGPISERLAHDIGPVDAIVNVASQSHVDRSIVEPAFFIENNVALMLNVLDYARLVQPRQVIQVSTDEVYGPAPDGIRHKEWDTILPSNPYAASKAAQEAIAVSYWRTYGVPLVITNTMNNYGERQDPEKFVPMCIAKISRGEHVTIHGTPPNRIGSRFYLHARNHADALAYLIRHAVVHPYPQATRPARFNIVGDREVDNLAMAQHIADVMERPLNVEFQEFHATRPGHDRRYALDGEKIAAYGWQAPVGFEESLERTVRWTLKNEEWLR